LRSLVDGDPQLWALDLEKIFFFRSKLGKSVEQITLGLAFENSSVREALERACEHALEAIRLPARGLRSICRGFEDPATGIERALADTAAHLLDGRPIFPHPLVTTSSTWLGSNDAETFIRQGVRKASLRFAAEVVTQGGDIEEALVKALVKEIESEFRSGKVKLRALGQSPAGQPILTLAQRPTSKSTEEPIYGCDLAWLIKANVPNRFRSAWAELVQIKKSAAISSGSARDSWKIELKQLRDILKWSNTASYWLIAAAGEVLVTPARHLEGLAVGRQDANDGKPLKQIAVGYNEIRSAAIPLENYLTDLLIGQWVGTRAPETLNFAEGGHPRIKPRVTIELSIEIDRHRKENSQESHGLSTE
jgi:hypothetical protein